MAEGPSEFLSKSLSNLRINEEKYAHTFEDYEERVKSALEYYLNLNISLNLSHPTGKNTEKARDYLNRANEKSSSPWRSSLELYNQAIIYALPLSDELSQAYSDRSLLLYNKGLFDDCLLDIERTLEIGYPDPIKAKLYTRRVQCLMALHKNIEFPTVQYALIEAHKWLDLMSDDDDDKINLNNILNNIHLETFIQPLEKFYYTKYIPRTPNDNPKIIGASSAIKLEYTFNNGKHLVATRDIIPGERIFVHDFYASVIDHEFCLNYCDNCSRRIWAGVPCANCINVIYCDEECRLVAWESHHDIECSVVNEIINLKMSLLYQMALRLTVYAYREAGSIINKLKKDIFKLDAMQDTIMRNCADYKYEHAKYSSVYSSMRYNLPINSSVAMLSGLILHLLASKTDILGRKLMTIQELLNNSDAIFLGGLILKNFCISQIGCVGLFPKDFNDKRKLHGLLMSSLVNLFNHSCDPMVFNYAAGEMNVCIAIQKIQRGQQIFLNREGFTFWEKPKYERVELNKIFGFVCRCRACLQNWGPELIRFFPNFEFADWPEGVVAKLDEYVGKYEREFLSILPNISDISSLLTITSYMMTMNSEIIEYPSRKLFLLKLFMIRILSELSP